MYPQAGRRHSRGWKTEPQSDWTIGWRVEGKILPPQICHSAEHVHIMADLTAKLKISTYIPLHEHRARARHCPGFTQGSCSQQACPADIYFRDPARGRRGGESPEARGGSARQRAVHRLTAESGQDLDSLLLKPTRERSNLHAVSKPQIRRRTEKEGAAQNPLCSWRRFRNEPLAAERDGEKDILTLPRTPRREEGGFVAPGLTPPSEHPGMALSHFSESSAHSARTFICRKSLATLPTVHEGVGENHHGVV